MSYKVTIDWSSEASNKWHIFDNHVMDLLETSPTDDYMQLWASEIEHYGGRVIEDSDYVTRLYFKTEAHYTWFLLRWS